MHGMKMRLYFAVQDIQEPAYAAPAPAAAHKPDLQKILRPVEIAEEDLLPHKNRKLCSHHARHLPSETKT